jgi:hypothetical protein
MPKEQAAIDINGLNFDEAWENIIKKIEGGEWNSQLTLEENIEIKENREKLLKEIERLEKLARKEVQPKKKFELVNQKRKLEGKFHTAYERGMEDGTLNSEISEETMFSSLFHIMLAAVTRYAVGLVYIPEGSSDPESELIMLKDLLMSKYVKQ